MKIVKLQNRDIGKALELVWNVFQEFVAPDYSEEGTATFKKFIEYDSIIQKLDIGEMQIWGCFNNHDLVGVIATLKINHISMLFTKKEYHRQGIAKKLFQKVVHSCMLWDKKSIITVNSSPYAVEAYRHLGFKDTNIEQTLNGIRFTPMEYRTSQCG
jgi:GNAT superfamily N-acetyltransferase